ncbi:MAG: tRNA pseudouridine(55) synthase TruB [Hyphomicrobium sp.]
MGRSKKGQPVHGWVALDKPKGLTSTQALAQVKRLFNAQKAGHAGTLDPLATGVLPIAFGEATKTVSFAVDDQKSYVFTVRWGAQTSTDDCEGEIVFQSENRPMEESILSQLPTFMGRISQVPPRYSAVKIDGKRAYDLARHGEDVELVSRMVHISHLALVDRPDRDTAVFEVDCGKGTYVRALARDLGRELGCFGHITSLRRTKVGPFLDKECWTLEELTEQADQELLFNKDGPLLPVAMPLKGLPELLVSPSDAGRLSQGIAILVRGAGPPQNSGLMYATCQGRIIALGEIDKGALHPIRVFNMN